jgi:hypothetical protein
MIEVKFQATDLPSLQKEIAAFLAATSVSSPAVVAGHPIAPAPAAVAPSPTVPAAPAATSAPPAPTPAAPSAPPAPAAAAAPAPPSTPAGDVDAAGLPWDERIHSGSRKKNKDGTWAKRRGVQGVLIEKVEKELRARMSNVASIAGLPPDLLAPPAPPAPTGNVVPPPGPPMPPQGEGITFARIIEGVQKAMSSGKWTRSTLSVKLAEFGLSSLEDLAGRPDLLPEFAKLLPVIE